jgi:hypothetical protein
MKKLTEQEIKNLKIGNYVYIPYRKSSDSHPLDSDSRFNWTTGKILSFSKHPRTNKLAVKVQYLDLFNANKLTTGIIILESLRMHGKSQESFINHPSISLQIKNLESKINNQ